METIKPMEKAAAGRRSPLHGRGMDGVNGVNGRHGSMEDDEGDVCCALIDGEPRCLDMVLS